jgi:Fe/S biogenesis protein NfuA
MTATDGQVKPVITISDAARKKILELRAEEEDAETLGLRIAVTGARGPEYAYDLAFDAVSAAEPTDVVSEWGGLTVIVPEDSVAKLQGAILDLPADGQNGMVLRNPNRPDPLAGMDVELTGDVPNRIQILLDKVINPNLAMHGGFAELRAWETPKAYVKMGGGCQGCAVSSITLKVGIERTLRSQIPEIEEVVDTTDHASGTNPYYEPAKK